MTEQETADICGAKDCGDPDVIIDVVVKRTNNTTGQIVSEQAVSFCEKHALQLMEGIKPEDIISASATYEMPIPVTLHSPPQKEEHHD